MFLGPGTVKRRHNYGQRALIYIYIYIYIALCSPYNTLATQCLGETRLILSGLLSRHTSFFAVFPVHSSSPSLCLFLCVCVCVCVCVRACVHACVRASVYVRACVRASVSSVYVRAYLIHCASFGVRV